VLWAFLKQPAQHAVILSSCIIFLFCGCSGIKIIKSVEQIKSIEVFALNWTLLTRYDLTSEDIVKYKKLNKHYYIKDEITLSAIADRLNNLKIKEGYNGVDVRMVCDITYENGAREELCFGGTRLIYYEEQCYERDTILVNLIENAPKISIE
jgi:hypothetical protein